MGFLSNLFRKADPVIVESSQALADLLGVGYESLTGLSVTHASAMRFSTVQACVRVIYETVGTLPLVLKEVKDGGNSSAAAVNHPLYRILKVNPNEFMTAAEFKELMAGNLASRGNFYAYKNVVRGELRELLPLSPSSVTPKLRDDWSVVYEVNFANGKTAVLTQDEVFHVRLFANDGLTGVSPIMQSRDSIGLALAAEMEGARMYKQGVKLSGVLSTDGTLSDEAYARIRSSWDTTYAGVSNAYKAAILEGGLKFTPNAMTATDAQWIEARKYQRSELAGIWRVPLHKIGDLEHATFSNIEHQSQEFVTDCLMPYLVKIEERVNMSLLSEKDRSKYYAKFNVNALLRGDMNARANFYTKLEQAGALSPNEIRSFEDMNPRDGGDIYLTPMNMAVNGKPIGENNAEKPA